MYLPKSTLYPLVILFTLGGVLSFYFEITSIPLFYSLGFTLIFYFLLKEKHTKLLKSGVLYFSFLLLGYIHFQEYYRLSKTHYQHYTLHDADALKRMEIKQLGPTHILLQNNVKVNLDLLLEEYKPKLLIAVGSNDPWFLARWEKICKKYNVCFYDTRKNGALKINLENEG